MNAIRKWFDDHWQRYRLYHLPFWIGYTLIWYGFSLSVNGQSPRWDQLPLNLVYLVCYLGVTYPNLYWLMPRYLAQKRYLIYILLNVGIVLFFSSVIASWYLFVLIGDWSRAKEILISPYFYGSTFWAMVFTAILTTVIKVIRDSRKTQLRNKQLEKEKLQTELQLLKAQLNPHFLFNAINSIYFLIRKDPELAEKSLVRFSEILRYQLYECESDWIPVRQEAEYLAQYLELARLRKGERLETDTEIDPALDQQLIAPFLLLPLLENAIKHLSHHQDQPNRIRMQLQKREDRLWFCLENTYVPVINQTPASPTAEGGIGLNNVKRRLNLLYPKQYQLQIQAEGGLFRVELSLPLQSVLVSSNGKAQANVFLPQVSPT